MMTQNIKQLFFFLVAVLSFLSKTLHSSDRSQLIPLETLRAGIKNVTYQEMQYIENHIRDRTIPFNECVDDARKICLYLRDQKKLDDENIAYLFNQIGPFNFNGCYINCLLNGECGYGQIARNIQLLYFLHPNKSLVDPSYGQVFLHSLTELSTSMISALSTSTVRALSVFDILKLTAAPPTKHTKQEDSPDLSVFFTKNERPSSVSLPPKSAGTPEEGLRRRGVHEEPTSPKVTVR